MFTTAADLNPGNVAADLNTVASASNESLQRGLHLQLQANF